jgi:YggT family protein
MSAHTADLLITFINYFTALIFIMVIASIISQMITLPYNRYVYAVRRFVDETVQPLFGIFRRILPSFGMIDLSPMVMLFALFAIDRILINIISSSVSP